MSFLGIKMEEKKLNAIFLFLLVLSIGFVYSATTSGSFSLEENEDGAIVIGESECSPNWECVLTECIDGFQTYICYDRNQCGTTAFPSNHGEIVSCPVEPEDNGGMINPSNSGSGGGSKITSSGSGAIITSNSSSTGEDCVENWVCLNWSNQEEECGVRGCTDLNSCGTGGSKPEVIRECESKGFFSFITGGVIGAFGSFGWWVLILFLVLIVAFFIVSKKKKKDNTFVKKKTSKKVRK
ncbi:MAG: hypothetical protein WC494_00045 [Candidatus Pacearchaeota archaeon]